MSVRDDLTVKLATYTGEQMVALAYDAIIENLEDAKKTINLSDSQIVKDKIDHNREILAHLTATLGEEEDEISITTKQLYIYINKLMTDGVVRKSIEAFDEAIKIITPLRDGWKELSQKLMDLESKKNTNVKKTSKNNVYTGITYGKDDVSVYSDSKDWEKG